MKKRNIAGIAAAAALVSVLGSKTARQQLKKFRDQLVIDQVRKAQLPNFSPDQICRYRITFSGRVQKVGFRLELSELAQRLELTGFCENMTDGRVLAEFQGPKNRICYLVSFVESLKRIDIQTKLLAEIPVQEDEKVFVRR